LQGPVVLKNRTARFCGWLNEFATMLYTVSIKVFSVLLKIIIPLTTTSSVIRTLNLLIGEVNCSRAKVGFFEKLDGRHNRVL
jgi:hypothetical protein